MRRVVLLLTAMLVASGCLGAPHLAAVRREIERQVPGVRFEDEVTLSLGPWALRAARLVARFLPDAAEASDYLADLQHVDLAVYRTRSLPPLDDLRVPAAIASRLAEDGWQLAVRVHESDEVVWVLALEEDDLVREIFVLALDDEELVLVHVEGWMDRIVARAMEAHPHIFPEALGVSAR